MKLFSIALLLLLSQLAVAQIKVTTLSAKQLPPGVKYKADFNDAISFTDKEGEHIVVTSSAEDEKLTKDSDEVRTAALYAYSYLIKGGKAVLSWQLYDFAEECQEDITADFISKALVTDLDKNGVNEVWLIYKTACRGDVSPSSMKIIMHEGTKKYALRGESRVKVNATDHVGGSYAFDPVFKSGPEAFRTYAQSLWKKYVNETSFF